MPPQANSDARARLLVLSAGCLWSLGGVFIKLLELHPLTIVFYRSFFASVFFLIFVRPTGWRFTPAVLVSVMSYTAAISAFVWANKLTTAANAIVLQYTAPIFVFLFAALWFRESVAKRNLKTLVAGMVGIAIIFGSSRAPADLWGVSAAVLSGLLFAVYMTNLRFLQKIAPASLTFVNNLACWLTLFPVVRTDLVLSLDQVLTLATMGVVQLGIPYFLFSKGLEKISLQEASLIVLIEPVLNPIWVALTIGELPAAATVVGGSIILLGLALRYFPERARPKPLS
ncbi:MAG: DMT family transporter [Candidatus Binatia bacterium]